MKRISRLTHYLKDYKAQIAFYFITNLLAILFGLFSFTMLVPVLQVLFKQTTIPATVTKSKGIFGFVSNATNYVQDFIKHQDPVTALAYVCILLVIFTVLKNLFLYLSLYILNPLRNAILRRLRDDIFTKTLSLPIGFFT